MKTIIFDGNKFVQGKIKKLKERVKKLKNKGKLVSLVVGKNERNLVYAKLKQKKAEEIGLKVEIKDLGENASYEEIKEEIEKLNEDSKVSGIMLQLPLTDSLKDKTSSLIHLIKEEKDIDGMRDDSCYLAPVVRAVMEIIKVSGLKISNNPYVVVLGSNGFVGKKLMKELVRKKFSPKGLDIAIKNLKKETLETDLLITTCHQPGIIGGEMVKEGAVIIDVSSPKGDVQVDEVIGKVKFISPVPGGVGPLTVFYLLENLVEKLEWNLLQ
jgi:methylenetetrahydrofolate dehydrogenase (NADP+)/methenyltetrahydrofolate cyclohydrolase